MATYKILPDKRQELKDGTYPLIVRVYNGRKFRSINHKTHLKESQFNTSTQKVKRNNPTVIR
jgi:hypothetical protein